MFWPHVRKVSSTGAVCAMRIANVKGGTTRIRKTHIRWAHTACVAKQVWPDVLRRKLKRDGLDSGVEVGARLGVTQSTASRWLNAVAFPEGERLSRVAHYLEMDESRVAALVHEAKRRRADIQAKIDAGEMIRTPMMTEAVYEELVEVISQLRNDEDPERAAAGRRILAGLAESLETIDQDRAQELRRLAE